MQSEVQKTVDEIKEAINKSRAKKSEAKKKAISDVDIRAKFSKALRLMRRIPYSGRLDGMVEKYEEQMKSGTASVNNAMTIAVWDSAILYNVFDHKKIQKAADEIRDYNPWIVAGLARFRHKNPTLALTGYIIVGLTLGLAFAFLVDSIANDESWSSIAIWVTTIPYVWKGMQIAEI